MKLSLPSRWLNPMPGAAQVPMQKFSSWRVQHVFVRRDAYAIICLHIKMVYMNINRNKMFFHFEHIKWKHLRKHYENIFLLTRVLSINSTHEKVVHHQRQYQFDFIFSKLLKLFSQRDEY